MPARPDAGKDYDNPEHELQQLDEAGLPRLWFEIDDES